VRNVLYYLAGALATSLVIGYFVSKLLAVFGFSFALFALGAYWLGRWDAWRAERRVIRDWFYEI
jgi:hypothetical protein